jgi:glycogen synthase
VAFPVKRSLLSKWKYRSAVRYLAVSRFIASELEASGVRAERIDTVFDAVPPAIGRNEWSPESPAVALASADPMKGRDLVSQAAKVSGVEVLYSDNLARDLKRACMFLYITRSEGLGSAALLAMNMGVPVIASKVGGLAEVLEDGVSGLYVANDVHDIVKAMRRVLASEALAQKLILGGQRRVADRFTPRHLLEGTLASYQSALVS